MPRTTHGMTYTPEFTVWRDAKSRCFNVNHQAYASYGGRGISMCDRWRDSFLAFYADMGPRPDAPPRYTLERSNNNGNYEPDNCRWATYTDQRRNTRRNRMLTHNGRTQSVTGWAEELNMTRNTIWTRLNRGWSIDKVFSTPLIPPKDRNRLRL